MATADRGAPRRLAWAAGLLGLALGGFFDGILLHQILQWHHLLSAVEGVRDLRLQILADGLFHALMYAVAAAALVLLWRARGAMAAAGSARRVAGAAALGFGTWHLLDAVLSHWLLGIHRVKMDAAEPLVWDLLWFAVFGLVPLLAGWHWLRTADSAGRGDGDDDGGRRARAASAVLGLAALGAGGWAALPPADAGQTLVVFAPGVSAAQAFQALAQADARVIGSDAAGGVWAVALPPEARAASLYRAGALWVGPSGLSLGCASWTRGGAA
ncbi:DUF2243 domain-containing protein [Xenophilus sp. Marseille-Q4582]|uniref:DUF2243 domain-containing protein n=1 Tax=Xenophilus sp. Marseille-Q4582 TaxID=2866600 RepID=UPI001CE3FC83|nr:DUF2243 domain-containing protein [Xenophilus sp. Marseille-Q4582]